MRKHLNTAWSILAGSVLTAIGIQFFLVQNQLVIGGISGLSIIINYFSGWPVGILIFAINAPIFLLALRHLGFLFLLTAFLGVVASSAAVAVLASLELIITEDMMLSAIFGGFFIGAGIAMLFRVGSSAGGVDIIARIILGKRPNLTLGWLMFLIDFSIIVVGVFIFREIEMALYAVISIFVLRQTVDMVLYRGKSKESAVETQK